MSLEIKYLCCYCNFCMRVHIMLWGGKVWNRHSGRAVCYMFCVILRCLETVHGGPSSSVFLYRPSQQCWCETAAYPFICIFKKGNKQPSLPNQRCAQKPQHQQHSPSSVFLSVCQNLFEADPKPCFTASPNSYYIQVFLFNICQISTFLGLLVHVSCLQSLTS